MEKGVRWRLRALVYGPYPTGLHYLVVAKSSGRKDKVP